MKREMAELFVDTSAALNAAYNKGYAEGYDQALKEQREASSQQLAQRIDKLQEAVDVLTGRVNAEATIQK